MFDVWVEKPIASVKDKAVNSRALVLNLNYRIITPLNKWIVVHSEVLRILGSTWTRMPLQLLLPQKGQKWKNLRRNWTTRLQNFAIWPAYQDGYICKKKVVKGIWKMAPFLMVDHLFCRGDPQVPLDCHLGVSLHRMRLLLLFKLRSVFQFDNCDDNWQHNGIVEGHYFPFNLCL